MPKNYKLFFMMTINTKEIRSNNTVKKRLAKVMALHCFRNTFLENLHSGRYPSSKTRDFSDVKVVSPFGEIPWNELSRFNDYEMKALMINVVNHCYNFLFLLYNSSDGDKLITFLKEKDIRPEWNDPTGDLS
jgi:hypothetical protein